MRAFVRRLLLAGPICVALVATMGFTVLPFGTSTHQLGTVATVEVPRRAALEAARSATERATWVSFRMDCFHPWAMGSGTPYRANLFVVLHAPGAPASSYDDAHADCERS